MSSTATDPLDDLRRAKKLRDDAEELMLKAVKQARRRGYSWYKIAPALDVSRQAVMEKYKPKVGR